MTYDEVLDLSAAAELAREGARTGVLEQLTFLSAPFIKRLIRGVTGCSPRSGQLPYSTNWYEVRRERLVHSSLFLRILQRESASTQPRSVAFAASHRLYKQIVELLPPAWQNHALDVNRAFLASQLLAIREFELRVCEGCRSPYITVNTAKGCKCHGCDLVRKH